MTITQPTGQLFTDLALFGAWFAFAVVALFIDTHRQARKGRK